MAYQIHTTSRLESLFLDAENNRVCLHSLNASDRSAIARRSCIGAFSKPSRGIYVRKNYWESLTKQDQARHLIKTYSQMRPSWIFSHSSSALIHHLEVPREIVLPIHYQTSTDGIKGSGPLVRHHKSSYSTRQLKDGIAINSVEQTVVDCAAEYPFQLALPIADSALHQGLTDKKRLTAYLQSRTNKRGIRKATRIIAIADPRPDNGGESRIRALMLELGLPEPELQAQIPNPERPGHYYYVDFLFTRPDGVKVAMELDGLEKYRNISMTGGKDTLHVMMAERQREAAITSHGIQMVRFGYNQALDSRFLLRRLALYGIAPQPKKALSR